MECFFEVNVVVLSPQAILQSLTSTTCCHLSSSFASPQIVRLTMVSEKLSASKGTSALRSAPSAICQNILALSFYCSLLGRDENQAKGSLHLASNSKQYQDLEESMKPYPSEKKGRRQAASISFSKNHCTVSIDLICMYFIVFPHQTQVHVPSVSRFWKPF